MIYLFSSISSFSATLTVNKPTVWENRRPTSNRKSSLLTLTGTAVSAFFHPNKYNRKDDKLIMNAFIRARQ